MIWLRIAAAAAVIAALYGIYIYWEHEQQGIGATRERAIWVTKLDAQKAEARTELDAANTRIATAEGVATQLRDAQNLRDVENAKISADYERRIAVGKRLRDPNATVAGCGGGSTTDRPTGASSAPDSGSNATEAPGLLSESLSGLFRTLTREADAGNIAYIASRADADQLRGLLQACSESRTPTP